MYRHLSSNLTEFARACPFPLYIVGGRVRDFIAGLRPAADFDVCAPADADSVKKIAEACGYEVKAEYKRTGTLKLEKDGEELEYAAFRTDKYVRGEHVPVKAYFTDDINLDARRRDFKCNAIYYDIAGQKFVDPTGGTEDIKASRITTVTDPEKVFGEDGLRLMRLARIAAQTGFEPAEDTMRAARKFCGLLKDVSGERIYAELLAILSSDGRNNLKDAPYRGLKILKETGALEVILPELYAGDGLLQRPDKHRHDVLEHSLRCAAYADPSVRFAALLHDVGKPYVYARQGNFHGHDEAGVPICAQICSRLKVPKKTAEEAALLIKTHMYDLTGEARESKVRKFIVNNLEIFDKILLIKQADYSASTEDFSVAPAVQKFTAIYEKMRKEGVPMTLKQLNLRGSALIAAGYPPQEVGAVLQRLLLDACTGTVKNEESALLRYALSAIPPCGGK